MAYDPQRDQPRHRPEAQAPSIVDTLLDPAKDPSTPRDEEPAAAAGPAAAPEPPNAWSERLLYSVGISTVLGAATGLAALAWLWRIWRRRTR